MINGESGEGPGPKKPDGSIPAGNSNVWIGQQDKDGKGKARRVTVIDEGGPGSPTISVPDTNEAGEDITIGSDE